MRMTRATLSARTHPPSLAPLSCVRDVPREDVAEQQTAQQRRVVAKEQPGRIDVAGERCNPYRISAGDVIKAVHRARMHRTSGPFQPGEKAPVVKERRLVSKLPAPDPSRSPSVDRDRSGFSFRHSVNVSGLHRNSLLEPVGRAGRD
jgi:hypothetical protein